MERGLKSELGRSGLQSELREQRAARGWSFVVQKPDDRRLHYDLRLELDGVLKSWAVSHGPSLNPEDKRLAVRTEDKPITPQGLRDSIPRPT